MRSVHFDAQGFTRTYWDFFSAFALFSPSFVWSRQLSQTTWRGSQRDQLNFRRQGRQGSPIVINNARLSCYRSRQ